VETIAGFPFFKLDFTKEGAVDASDHSAAAAALADPGITELLILSHGWNNDIAEARTLYEELLGNLRSTIDREGEAARSIAVVGVYWPSKRFTDDALRPSADPGGGSASITGAGNVRLLADKLDRLGELLGDIDPAILDRAKAALPDLEDRAKARTDFVEALQAMLPQPSDTEDDNSARLFTPHNGDDILNALSDPVELADDRDSGGGVTALLDEGRGRGMAPAQLFDLLCNEGARRSYRRGS
jgi:hypothetical protein